MGQVELSADVDGVTTDLGAAHASTSLFHSDGSRTVRIDDADLILASGSSDTFLNGGQPDNPFVFQPGYGADVIQGFLATGADHDILSMPVSDFASIAQTLKHTRQAAGGAVIHDPASGDTIELTGISKTELTRHRGDFSLHG